MLADILQLLIAGLATGAIYALVAIGFTLLWQTSQTINFAQGEFVMLPAFFILAAMNAGAPFWLATLIGIVLSVVVLGWLFKVVIVDPMLKHGVLPLVIAKGAGANSRQILGTTVMGGMLAATLLAIFIIPVTFYVAERFSPKKPEPSVKPGAAPAPIHGGSGGKRDTPPEAGKS